MNDSVGVIIATLGAATLFIVGVLLLAVAALVWARSIAEAVRARAHRIETDSNEEILSASREATDAAERARRARAEREAPPTDEQYIATLLEERRQEARAAQIPEDEITEEQHQEFTTIANEHFEEGSEIPDGRMFVPPEEAAS